MSGSSKPRIKRGSGPSGKLSDHNVRERALPYLLKDFEHRCAYSMRHVQIAGGLPQMEIDHFDPTLSGRGRNAYSNLMLATRLCNNVKRDAWPLKSEASAGVRFLNPTVEIDYGEHLFEDQETHELVGVTPEGRYHIDALDLNNETFVWERSARAEYARIRAACPAVLSGSFDNIRESLEIVHGYLGLWIPPIPPPPASHSEST